MITVTVARRPPVEVNVASNVLVYGCGALAINATRVEGAPEVPGSAGSKGVDSQVYMPGLNATAARRAAAYIANPPSGRWPANLVLEHPPECQQVGTTKRKFKGLIIRRQEKSAAVGMYSPGVAQAEIVVSPCVDADGMEEVATWECVPGCPIAALDEQSGAQVSRPNKYGKIDEHSVAEGYGVASWNKSGPNYGDRGGASRFFKQVKGEQEHD